MDAPVGGGMPMVERAREVTVSVMDKIAPVEGEENQLTAGLKDAEADADWKKKVIYD